MHTLKISLLLGSVLLGAAGAAQAQLMAVPDEYGVPFGEPLVVEDPGVLENDTFNGDPATDFGAAIDLPVIVDVAYGTLILNSNGSFSYTPGPDFPGIDSFTYQASFGGETSQAKVTLTACNGGPVFTCWKESAFLTKFAERGYGSFEEGFENDAVWGAVREPDTALSVLSQGITWQTNHPDPPASNQITTGGGAARTGLWGLYDPNHGYATGTVGECDVDVPPEWCRQYDGVTGVPEAGAGSLFGVGGYFTGTDQANLALILDGGGSIPLGKISVGTEQFFGVIDTAPAASGFTTFRFQEIDGKVGQSRLVFADDFTFATLPADTAPPQVILVNSWADTGDGVLSEGEVTEAGINQLMVTFDEPVLDLGWPPPDSATNPANYLLFSDGGDGFDTVGCAAGVATGDAAVAVDWVTYVSGSEGIVTLDINGGVALPSAAYRLLVCGSTSIKDAAGNKLDGDGNGTGGDDFVRNFTIGGTPVNQPPAAVNDAYSTNEDTPLNIAAPGVLGNDSDPDGGAITASRVASPAHGSLVLNADGSFSYTPNANFNGPDSFTYQASDGLADSNIATVAITVNPVNDAPTAANDAYGTTEGTPLTVAAPGVLGNDGDLDGDSVTAVGDSLPANGTLLLNGDGSFVYTPTANFNGPDSFTYHATDGLLNSNVATVTITVSAVNDPPTAVDDAYATDEDTPLTVALPGVLGNDSDPESDPMTAVLVTGPANGALVLAFDGSFTYTPNLDFSGSDSFTYQANDGSANSNLATVTITVNAVNDPPMATNDAYGATEGTPLTVAAPGVLGNDGDPDGDSVTAVFDTLPANGNLVLNGDGSFVYTPNANFNGPDSFTYHATDGLLNSNVATVTITVSAVNDPPTAVDDAYATDEDTPLTVALPGVLINDSDVDSTTITSVLVAGPSSGTLALSADGSFTYTPNANFNGSDSFTYRANDGLIDSNVAAVTITVNAMNDAPVAANDAYGTTEGTPLTVAAPGVLGNDGDLDGDSVTAVFDTLPANGTLVLNGDGSFVYTPNANFNGPDSFTYHATDGLLNSNVATVTITVGAVNDPPTAVDDAYATDEDTVLTVAGPGVLGNDSDPETDPITAVLVTGPASGTLTLNSDGSFTYTPNLDFSGSDSFTYQANDGSANSNLATVTITVNAVDDAPVAADDAYTTDEDVALNIAAPGGVLINDSDVDSTTITSVLVAGPSSGTLALSADGSFTYTPTAGFTGDDSFTYQAFDASSGSNVATVRITVKPVNDAPVAADDAYSTDEDTVLNIAAAGVLINDSDVDSTSITSVLVAGPSSGALALSADGSFTYTPNANFNGSDSFTYRANDGLIDSNVAAVTITVNAMNDAPVAANDAYGTNEGSPLTVAAPGVLVNDSDVDGQSISAVWDAGPTNGTLTLAADGSFTYTPNANFNGTDQFTYKADDGSVNSNVATVTITVGAVNDPPTAVDDAYATDEDTPLTVALPGVLGNDSDPESDPMTAVLVTGPANGTLALNSDGSFTYTPKLDFSGSDSFTYQVNDGVSDSNIATVAITVNPVNDVPASLDDAYATDEDTVLAVAAPGVLGNDSDADNDPLTATQSSDPTNGTLVFSADGSFSYTPNKDFAGTDTFTYEASDGSPDSSSATVTITVPAINDPPVAEDQDVTTDEDAPVIVTLVASDSEDDALTYSVISNPAHGTISGPAPKVTYTPDADFFGSDSFTFRANDGLADSNLATVSITVNPINDVPVADDQSVSTDLDVPVGVTLTATDVDGDGLTYTVEEEPVNGTLSGDAPNLTYTPDAGFIGQDSFTFTANDTTAISNLATVTITVAPIQVLEIFEIQGWDAVSSPWADTVVSTVENVVTAVKDDGFFIQTPRNRDDDADETSNGIFVFTDLAPTVAVGDLVDVTGRVIEFFGFTQITGGPKVTITSTGQQLPKPHELHDTMPSGVAGDLPELERYEGMLVTANGIATGPTDLFGNTPVVARFERSFREPGIEYPGLPDLPVWDGNPEVFELDPDGLLGMPDALMFSGQEYSADGVIAEASGSYRLLPSNLQIEDPPHVLRPVREPSATEFTIASQNLGGLSAADGNLTLRLEKSSWQIRNGLRAPDIVAVQDVDSIETLQGLADRIAADDSELVYTPYLVEGAGPVGMNIGFLVRDTVLVRDVSQYGEDLQFLFDDELHATYQWPPLVLRAEFVGDGQPVPIVVIGNHLRSMDGFDDDGGFALTQRYEQALRLSEFVQNLQITNPDTRFVVTGGFNAYEFTDGYVDVVGQVSGSLDPLGALMPGTDEVEPDLHNESMALLRGERYTVVERRFAACIDSALTSRNLMLTVADVQVSRGNADAPAALSLDGSTPMRASDHDGVVLYLLVDSDHDGVPNQTDLCSDTVIPESIPWEVLKTNRWALTDDDGSFDTVRSHGQGGNLDTAFTVVETAGCSCEQIAVALGLGKGHSKYGCSTGVMEDWIVLNQP